MAAWPAILAIGPLSYGRSAFPTRWRHIDPIALLVVPGSDPSLQQKFGMVSGVSAAGALNFGRLRELLSDTNAAVACYNWRKVARRFRLR